MHWSNLFAYAGFFRVFTWRQESDGGLAVKDVKANDCANPDGR